MLTVYKLGQSDMTLTPAATTLALRWHKSLKTLAFVLLRSPVMDSFAGMIEVYKDALVNFVIPSAPHKQDVARDVPVDAIPASTHVLGYSTFCIIL